VTQLIERTADIDASLALVYWVLLHPLYDALVQPASTGPLGLMVSVGASLDLDLLTVTAGLKAPVGHEHDSWRDLDRSNRCVVGSIAKTRMMSGWRVRGGAMPPRSPGTAGPIE
jgi:hypothetical protein